MELGQFSVSLAVADLQKSLAFYEKLGFAVIAGEAKSNWLILKNGVTHIGLFQGMFDANIMTFNPKDARTIERDLKETGIEIHEPTKGDEGPTHLSLRDPDGNVILIDQH